LEPSSFESAPSDVEVLDFGANVKLEGSGITGLASGDFLTIGLSDFLILGKEVAGLLLKMSKLMAVTVFFSTALDTGKAGEIAFELEDFTVVFIEGGFPAAAVAPELAEDPDLTVAAALESFSLFICCSHFVCIASAKFFTNI
jgi:hypothetical protein